MIASLNIMHKIDPRWLRNAFEESFIDRHMRVEQRQTKLAANAEAIERWQRKLFRAANELQKLARERKRLLGKPTPRAVKYRNMDEIRMAAGGNEFNDDLPL
jgi:hypothetical protein